ncbi:SH3 domain-containing protein [Calothrix sp. FACHB-1219]|uniref:SH3 domain-containing protein n=1 Tax=unclassified Calothrix TaxID=2619626 RepID=UPI00168961E0|nr:MULTISPECIES: SH3 domain-containing protein [unclassified Calothrix]MBD2208190.1 SH3 domain-containing protein [Calothrix sp. FACHB-168]MBD2220360.1 SH3 domain-containing protein [Calothrix sp. FACHB-1219]
MFSINKHGVDINGKISVILAGAMLAVTSFTLPTSANVSNTITQKEIGGQLEILARSVEKEKSYNSPTVSQNGLQFKLAQSIIGACVVSVQSGSLNIRENPSTNSRVIGSLQNGDRVGFGVSDGSEGNSWTRIVYPIEGFVHKAYLKNCRTSSRYQ